MSKFLVIDGSSMLVTAYYGTLPKSVLFAKTDEEKQLHYGEIMHASDGTYTNAVYTMLRAILKIIDEQKPDYMAVAFDKSRNTFRREIYPNYKANRGETPFPLKQQFVLMENILEQIGITVLYSDKYEADDLAGSVIETFKHEKNVNGTFKYDLYFLTKDHDYLQLIDTNVHGWMIQTNKDKVNELWNKYYYPLDYKTSGLPNNAIEFNDDVVLGEEGVHSYQIADLKGISGDTSDNIPGVKGVKSATAPLLIEYGTVEGIYEAIENCQNDKKKEKELVEYWKTLGITRSPLKALKENKEIALLSKQLATINCNVPVNINIDAYHVNINRNALQNVIMQHDFKSLVI